MPPSLLVRETALTLLKDPVNGLNPTFTGLCEAYHVPVPLPGTGGTDPFSFTPESPTFLTGLGAIDHIEKGSEVQYPFLMIGTKSLVPEKSHNNITPSVFWGLSSLELRVYFAWSTGVDPANQDFEVHLDLFQAALLNIFRGVNPQAWLPVVFSGDVSEVSRDDMKLTNNGQLWRRGAHYLLTARVYQ